MVKISNGARILYQWERGVKLTVTGQCDIVRMSREDDSSAKDFVPYKNGAEKEVEVPDFLLTESGYLRVSIITRENDTERILETARFIIRPMQKSNNRAMSEQDLGSWIVLKMRMDALERAAREGKFNGDDGITPHIGENGNWYIGDIDTGVRAAGEDGITPHIGENGNWFLGDTDTGVPATGGGGIEKESDPTVPEWAKQPNKPTYNKSEVGLGNVANERQYSAKNPPPYPVKSVNGETGEVETPKAFYIVVTDSGNGKYTIDKTADKIKEAYNDKYTLFAKQNDLIMPLRSVTVNQTPIGDEWEVIFEAEEKTTQGFVHSFKSTRIRLYGMSTFSVDFSETDRKMITQAGAMNMFSQVGHTHDASEITGLPAASDTPNSVKQYGAKGDGTTDDTAAFKEALEAERVVYVPGGTYKLSDTLFVGENCCLELSQDTVLEFTQTDKNCITLLRLAHLKGNHATIFVPYAFAANVINCDGKDDTDQLDSGDYTTSNATAVPPWTKWDPQWKMSRYVTDINICKRDYRGFLYSVDGTCSGTAIYLHLDEDDFIHYMWGVDMSGVRIAGAFTYGIRVINVGDPMRVWNHDMRIEAIMDACKIGLSVDNCHTSRFAVVFQPRRALATDDVTYTPYAERGIELTNCRNIDLSGCRVWDWNATNTLWRSGNDKQHLVLIGDCTGLILDDFIYYEESGDLRDRIYTDTPANFEKMTILQEPITRWFRVVDGVPYYVDENTPEKLAKQADVDLLNANFITDTVPTFTNQLAIAVGSDGKTVYNGIGYKNGTAINVTHPASDFDYAYTAATGFIPCKIGSRIRTENFAFANYGVGNTRIVFYDANRNSLEIGGGYALSVAAADLVGNTGGGNNYTKNYVKTDNGFEVTIGDTAYTKNVAYVRFVVNKNDIGENPVITVDEEIEYVSEGFLADGIKVKVENVVGGGGTGGSTDDGSVKKHNESETAHEDIRRAVNVAAEAAADALRIANAAQPAGDYLTKDDLPGAVKDAVSDAVGDIVGDAVEDVIGDSLEDIVTDIVEDIISGEGDSFSETGDVVELAAEEGTPLSVVSKIHRDSTWGLSNELVLHQVSGSNFVDLSAYLGGAGTVLTKNGLTATVNADGTVTIIGTNESTSATNIINKNYGAHTEKVYPAGTYRIPDGFIMQFRAAQYPDNITITGVTGNRTGTVTIPEPFRVVSLVYAVKANTSVDVTVPLGLFRGNVVPETGHEYIGNLYTATFDAPVYDGEFNWSTGELKDADGNTVAYYDSHDIVSLPGTNYFWTGFGENTVSNVPKDLGKVVIKLNETAPDETVSSICDFLYRPTTPTAIYSLDDGKVLPNGGAFYGHEIPLITSKGTLEVVDAQGEVITRKLVDALISHRGVDDVLTNKGIHKAWSDKFYFTKEPVAQEDFSYSGNQTNSLYTFEFTEEDFRNVGMPAKLDNIPIVSPCFYTEDDAPNKLTQRVYGAGIFPATLSWDASSQKYIFKVRGYRSGYIMAQLQKYTKAYLHYQLETPYDDSTMFAMGISAGDKVTFTADESDWKPYLDAGLYSGITEVDVTPTVAIQVPRNTADACDGMINAARMLNMDETAGGDATVQGYSWIGEGDGVTDYTARLQSKLDEIHTVTNGGTIYLGPGTYPIGGSLIIYSNTRIIGYGVDTVVQQSADNTHAIVINGDNITLKDFSIKHSGSCDQITACVYVNSDNQTGENGYPSNYYVSSLTMDNIFMSGNYKFEHVDGKPILGDVYHNYKGVGIFCEGLYFNYAHIDNVHGKYLMAVVRYGGGGNYFNITSEYCKYAVYNGGVNNVYFINGHSYYEGNDTDGYVSMSDEVVHDEGSHFNQYTLSLYDCQHFKHYIYFGGGAQTNSYTINNNLGASMMTSADLGGSKKTVLSQHVIDMGRGNIQIAKWQDNAYAIGNKTLQISGQTTMIKCDPVVSNALSGAGVWGSITSNITWQNDGIDLYEICRYKADRIGSNSYLYLPAVISEASPSEDAPIEIEIDIRNRPIYGQLGHFIQFDHRYVASEYIVYYDTQNNGEYDISYTIKDNVDVTCWMLMHQNKPYNIYRIKFAFTKALQIPEFTYQDSGFRKYTINYNPEGLIGICNIGMTVNDYAGRSFLGECGGSLYGNVDMHQNTLKNLPAPVEDGDAVSKTYLEQRLAELEALIGKG